MPLKAVIFDMDGVLVDSMRYHVKAWQDTFKPLGLAISANEVYAREGESWKKSTADFLKMAGLDPKPPLVKRVFKKRAAIFKSIFKPRVFSGAKSVLTRLKKKGYKIGLVTATPWNEARHMLLQDMICLLDAKVCGGDTKKGKPHPQPYLKALERLSVKPSEAVVIENAPYGIRSAKLAGIKCIAVATSLPRSFLKEADIVVDSLKEVKI